MSRGSAEPEMRNMLRTPLCEKLGIKYPVMQAGMGIFKGVVTPPEHNGDRQVLAPPPPR